MIMVIANYSPAWVNCLLTFDRGPLGNGVQDPVGETYLSAGAIDWGWLKRSRALETATRGRHRRRMMRGLVTCHKPLVEGIIVFFCFFAVLLLTAIRHRQSDPRRLPWHLGCRPS